MAKLDFPTVLSLQYTIRGAHRCLKIQSHKRAAIAAAIGAVVAIPLPFIGPILGAIVGGGIGYFTAQQRRARDTPRIPAAAGGTGRA